MTFWSGAKLVEGIPENGIVEPFDENQIDCNAITLTLGPEVFVTPDYETEHRSNLKRRLDEKIPLLIKGKKVRSTGGTVKIPAGHFAYLITEETVKIPYNAMGFISLKSGIKWRGLINVSGFHVDPGFHGKLIYSVYNAGPSPIHLARGEDVFLLWLANLDKKASSAYAREDKWIQTEISTNKISEVDRPIHSLPKLSEKIESLSNEFNNMKIFAQWAIALVTVAAAIISAALSSQIFESRGGNPNTSQNSNLEDEKERVGDIKRPPSPLPNSQAVTKPSP